MTKTDYEDIFGVPGPEEATRYQDAKHAVAVANEAKAAELRLQAAQNRRYAKAIRETITRTGRGSLYMAQLHETCAARKEAEAERIFPHA